MAPKKTAAKTEKVAVRRIAKRKEIKEKPKLRIPTVVKVKVPIKKLSKTPTFCVSENIALLTKKAKDLTSNDKLELANIAATAQLNNCGTAVLPMEQEPPKKENQVAKKRPGRKKKVLDNNDDDLTTCGTDEEFPVQPAVSQPKRKYVKKTLAIPAKKAPTNTVKQTTRQPLKRKLVSPIPETTPTKKPKRKWTQSRITDMKIIVRRNFKDNSNGDKSRTVAITKPTIVRKRGPRGKKNDKTSLQGSPSILNQHATAMSQDLLNIKREEDDTVQTACAVESRKTSFNSEFSWTKDISDSSHTTCVTAVTSSDIVRIDKKLPKISLQKVESFINTSGAFSVEKEFTPRTPSDTSTSSSDSDSSDSDDSDTKCNSYRESDVVDGHSLNLSTSSESHRSAILQKNININAMNNTVNKIDRALEKLSLSMKKIDMEIINWVGYQNEDINVNNKKLKDKIHQNLQEESNIILQCQHVRKLLTENEESGGKEPSLATNTEVKSNDAHFVKPTDVVLPKTLNKNSECSNMDKPSHKDDVDDSDNKFDVDNPFASDNIPYMSFDQSLDDDALSLYAESIGFESHRNSISSPPHNAPDFEEYIPQPVKSIPPNIIVYNPTKITSNDIPQITEANNVRPVAAVCEKQNADSTSVVREVNQAMNRIEGIEKLPVPINNPSVSVQMKKGPCLLASQFKPLHGCKSTVFKGMCFFNLNEGCKNLPRCRFPHIEPARIEICEKLAKLSEYLFIQEYMLMKSWPGLRRKYGVCFINECKRRDLTRLLLEMAIDFVMKANQSSVEDAALKVYVLEEALLYLNNVDLQTYDDLLRFGIQGKHLCDYFMQAIAKTQNFSRFKPVFLKLTRFVVENEKVFCADVATHILERVAILPFEESLAWALISIIENTDAVIFENSMMAQFEKQLLGNERLLGALLAARAKAGLKPPVVSPVYNPAVPPPVIRQEERTMSSPLYPDRVQRYTSPDTTHLDSMNKPEEPVITRTIHFNFPNSSSSSESTEEHHPRTSKPNSMFSSWREKSIFNKLTPPRYQHPNKRRMDRQVTYGASPTKFPRHTRPDYF